MIATERIFMDRTERFYRIDQLLRANQVVPAKRFLEELEISLATFTKKGSHE